MASSGGHCREVEVLVNDNHSGILPLVVAACSAAELALFESRDTRWRWKGRELIPEAVVVRKPGWRWPSDPSGLFAELDAALSQLRPELPGLVTIAGGGGARLDGHSLCIACLTRALAEQVPVQTMAPRVVAALLSLTETRQARVEILAPVKNLHCSFEEHIDLGAGVVLHRLSEDELDWMNGSFHHIFRPAGWALSVVQEEPVTIRRW